jgi:protein arginine N-methyltransferase 3
MTNDDTNSEKLLDENDTWSNCDDWEEDSDANCSCPFCELKFPASTECFSHTRESHKFDFHLIKKTLHLDFYCCMRLVNYVRQNSALKMDEVIANFDEWKDDQSLMIPVLQDDALLYGIYFLRSI